MTQRRRGARSGSGAVASPVTGSCGIGCTGAPAGGAYSGIHDFRRARTSRVVGRAVALAPRDHLPHGVLVGLARLRDAQLRMRRGLRRLLGSERLLVELLAGTQAREHDAEPDPGRRRRADHVAREIDDAHRLAHVEHEDLAALALQARLQQELRRLRTAT